VECACDGACVGAFWCGGSVFVGVVGVWVVLVVCVCLGVVCGVWCVCGVCGVWCVCVVWYVCVCGVYGVCVYVCVVCVCVCVCVCEVCGIVCQNIFRMVHDRESVRGSTVVKVLRYKLEGRWFDSRWCRWNFSLT